MAHVEKTIEVDVPVHEAFERLSHFEQYPRFMERIQKVQETAPRQLHWVAKYGGKRNEWDTEVVEVTPDRRIAWRRTDGERNDGVVTTIPIAEMTTRVQFAIDFDPEAIAETAAHAAEVVDKRLEYDLRKLKQFIEAGDRQSLPQTAANAMLLTPRLNPLESASASLLALGGINMALLGLGRTNMVERMLGKRSRATRLVYAAIGIAGVHTLMGLMRAEIMHRRQR